MVQRKARKLVLVGASSVLCKFGCDGWCRYFNDKLRRPDDLLFFARLHKIRSRGHGGHYQGSASPQRYSQHADLWSKN